MNNEYCLSWNFYFFKKENEEDINLTNPLFGYSFQESSYQTSDQWKCDPFKTKPGIKHALGVTSQQRGVSENTVYTGAVWQPGFWGQPSHSGVDPKNHCPHATIIMFYFLSSVKLTERESCELEASTSLLNSDSHRVTLQRVDVIAKQYIFKVVEAGFSNTCWLIFPTKNRKRNEKRNGKSSEPLNLFEACF